MEHFVFAFNALMPLLFIALIGYFIRRWGLIGQDFINGLNMYIFYIALPILIFSTLSGVDDLGAFNWPVILFAIAMISIVLVVGFFFLSAITLETRTKEVVLQAFFRGNFVIIGIPLAMRIGGEEAINVVILLNAFMIPISNTFSILVFRVWRSSNGFNMQVFMRFIDATFKNPIMIGVILGIIGLMLQDWWISLTETVVVIPDTIDFVVASVTPMALIAVGAQFQMKRARVFARPIAIGVIGRMIVVPAVVFTLALTVFRFIDFSGTWPAMIAVFASPIAISSVAITKGLDGDDELAGHMVIFSTALAVFTIFILVVLFRSFGML